MARWLLPTKHHHDLLTGFLILMALCIIRIKLAMLPMVWDTVPPNKGWNEQSRSLAPQLLPRWGSPLPELQSDLAAEPALPACSLPEWKRTGGEMVPSFSLYPFCSIIKNTLSGIRQVWVKDQIYHLSCVTCYKPYNAASSQNCHVFERLNVPFSFSF